MTDAEGVECKTKTVRPPSGSGSSDGVAGYVYLSPGIIAAPLGDDDFEDVSGVSYQWGVGGGAVFRPKGRFGLGIGLGIEHMPVNVDEDLDDFCGALGNCDIDGHVVRFVPELRLGAMLEKVFVYGMISPGLGLAFARVSGTALGQDFDEDDVDPGFNLGLGAGVQGFVWRSLAIGGELGVDLGFYAEDEDDDVFIDPNDEDFQAHTLDIKILVAWYF